MKGLILIDMSQNVTIKRVTFLFLLLSIITFLHSCTRNNNLNAEGYLFYTMNEYGVKEQQSDAKFEKGQTIILYLLNVGQFKANSDKQFDVNMDVEIIFGKRKIIFKKENYMGRQDVTFERDTIPYLYALWQAGPMNEAGDYTFKITVKDMVSGDKSIFKPSFTIIE